MESIFNDFINGATGNRPDDYYYMYNANGAKYFYSKITGKKVAKNSISEKFHSLIKENDNLDINGLLKTKNGYLLEIERLQAKIKVIDIKLQGSDILAENLKRKQEQDAKDKARIDEYEKERLRNLFEQFANKPSSSVDVDILTKLNINTKKDWKLWLLYNHPDKRSDQSHLCAEVITAGRNNGW
jgi:hypothetical protein